MCSCVCVCVCVLQVAVKRGGRTELHLAASCGDVDVIKTLLEFKADINSVVCDLDVGHVI